MERVIVACFGVMWIGASIALSAHPAFRRVRLAGRLAPYSSLGVAGRVRRGGLTSVRDVIAPLARFAGDAVARSLGVTEELSVRMERARMADDPTEFRVRQLVVGSLGALGGSVTALALAPPTPVGILLVLAPPLIVFLVLENRVNDAAARRQDRLRRELPVMAEQLGMLLSCGYSLASALHRLAGRAGGVTAEDLTDVAVRHRHGIGEVEALREWAGRVRLDSLDRLVDVLALNREAGDLGHLISAEARSMRRQAHRELLEQIERRSQMVWVPVTVATLVPGVLFLAVPFVATLSHFTGP